MIINGIDNDNDNNNYDNNNDDTFSLLDEDEHGMIGRVRSLIRMVS